MQTIRKIILPAIITVMLVLTSSAAFASEYETGIDSFSYNGYTIPAYDGDPSEQVNSNKPKFSDEEKTKTARVNYGNLDSKGRCTSCFAMLHKDLMPTGSRGSISSVYPTGWEQKQYDNVSGKWLYNRCHLIGWQLTGADLNTMTKAELSKNLITGTRYLNVGDGSTGMLEYENQVADFVKHSKAIGGGYVAYRVTPVFKGNDLLARGVLMEGESVTGTNIKFCVFCYNVQPGIAIDYATGDSKLASQAVDTVSINSCSCTVTPTIMEYNGKTRTVTIKLSNKGTALKKDVDYTSKYSNNKYPGKAKVNIVGIGKYNGSRTAVFYIVPAKGSVTAKYVKKGKMKMTAAKKTGASGYQFAYKKKSASDWKMVTQKSRTKTVKGLKKKTTYQTKVRAYVTIDGKKYYGKWSAVKTCKIKK